MAIYVEKPEKLNLAVSNSDNPVKLKVDCQYGTVASVAFNFNGRKTVRYGNEIVIGSANALKGKRIKFTGISSNPERGKIKTIHEIFEKGGNSLTYVFPDYYTGDPVFNTGDAQPTYEFTINFK
jgi:hypothetical protein